MRERLTKIRENRGLSKQEFADKLSLKLHNIRDMESGKQKISSEIALKIEEIFSVNGWWLLTGKGDMLEENKASEPIEPPTSLISISYFKDTYAAAGVGAINYDNAPIVMAFEKEFLREKLGITSFKHLHIINSIGNSMYPTIQTGELLFINPFENEDFIIKDKDIYVLNTPNGVLVKRIKIEHPIQKQYTLVSDNPQDPDIPLKGDDIDSCKILGRVVGHFNKL